MQLWRISRASMQALDEESKRQFARRMAGRLGKEFPQKRDALGPEGMAARIESGIRAALRYEIDDEPDIETFLRLFFMADFEIEARWPWAGSLLDDRALDADERLSLLLKTVAGG